MKRLIKLIAVLVILFIGLRFFGPSHLQNGLKYWFSDVDDYKIFSNHTIQKSSKPIIWQYHEQFNKQPLTADAKAYFDERKTCAYLIVKDGKILQEHYFQNYNEKTISGSFSVAKTVNALLIGKLIEEGKIASINDDVKKYVPELTQIPDGKLSIKDVITMSGSIDWKESYWNMFSLTAQSYYGNNLDNVLGKLKLKKDEKPGTIWEYQSCCTQILGYIIRKASGKTISEYAQETLWQPLGMESDALWSLDHEDGIERSFCCINATAKDFAKLGYLILNQGKVDSTQLINTQWIKELTSPATHLKTTDGRTCDWYGYQTWIINYKGINIPYFRGVHGQFIFVIPEKNAVIVRLGKIIKKQNIDAHEQNDDIKKYLEIGLAYL